MLSALASTNCASDSAPWPTVDAQIRRSRLAATDPDGGQSLRLSQMTLAAMIGATRENVNRSLAGLADEDYIDVAGRSITILDPDALRRLGARAAPLLPTPNRPSRPASSTGG